MILEEKNPSMNIQWDSRQWSKKGIPYHLLQSRTEQRCQQYLVNHAPMCMSRWDLCNDVFNMTTLEACAERTGFINCQNDSRHHGFLLVPVGWFCKGPELWLASAWQPCKWTVSGTYMNNWRKYSFLHRDIISTYMTILLVAFSAVDPGGSFIWMTFSTVVLIAL